MGFAFAVIGHAIQYNGASPTMGLPKARVPRTEIEVIKLLC